MLREARSLSRRADKLSGTAAAVDDPTTQQLAAEACTSMEQLVHHLMVPPRDQGDFAGLNVGGTGRGSSDATPSRQDRFRTAWFGAMQFPAPRCR